MKQVQEANKQSVELGSITKGKIIRRPGFGPPGIVDEDIKKANAEGRVS